MAKGRKGKGGTKGKITISAKPKVKMGSTNKGNSGGIFTAKIVAIGKHNS